MNICCEYKCLDKINIDAFAKVYYLGGKCSILHELQDLYSQVLSIGSETNNLFDELRDEMLNFDKQINKKMNSLWLASDLAENNYCLGDFTLLCVKSVFLLRILSTTKDSICFVCDSARQVKIFTAIARFNTFKVTNIIYRNWPTIKRRLGFLYSKIRSCIQDIYKILFLKIWRFYKKRPIDYNSVLQSKVITVNWLGSKTLESNNLTHNDRYFGNLLADFDKRNFNYTTIFKPLDFAESYKEIIINSLRNREGNIYFIYDFISIIDILKNNLLSFMFPKTVESNFVLSGYDLSPIVSDAIFDEILKSRIPCALLFNSMVRKLQSLGLRNTKILYPYENQPWEKVLTYAAKKNIPGVKVLAYQHFPIAYNYLASFMSKNYVTKMVAPHSVLASDKKFIHNNITFFRNNTELVGNLRYKDLLKQKVLPGYENKYSLKTILCSCAMQVEDSLELVYKTIQVVNELYVEYKYNIKIIVNLHPLMSKDGRESIAKILSNNSQLNMILSNQSAEELLKIAGVLMYNANSICFNAAIAGIPSIFVQSDSIIDLNRMQESPLQFRCIADGVSIVHKLLADYEFYKSQSEKMSLLFAGYYQKPLYEEFFKSIIGTTYEKTKNT